MALLFCLFVFVFNFYQVSIGGDLTKELNKYSNYFLMNFIVDLGRKYSVMLPINCLKK